MRRSVLCTVVSGLVLPGLLGAPALWAAESSPARAAVERSLPNLEQGGLAWMDTRGCMSCHTFAFTLWSFQAAKQRGFAVDQAKLDNWIGRAKAEARGKRPWFKMLNATFASLQTDGVPEPVADKLKPLAEKAFETEPAFVDELAKLLSAEELDSYRPQILKWALRENDPVDTDTYAELILGGAPFAATNLDPDWLVALTGSVVQTQSAGSWSAGGQLPRLKRPKPEQDEVATMWLLLALASRPEIDAQSAAARQQALAWLDGQHAEPGRSNESLLLHLLVQHKFGTPERTGALLKQVWDEQNPDGGWSWVRGEKKSDAFATGQSLYALGTVGVPLAEPAFKRARGYLVKTQQPGGSWTVYPDGFNDAPDEGRLKRTAPIWTYWGSTWATIGLLQTLPD